MFNGMLIYRIAQLMLLIFQLYILSACLKCNWGGASLSFFRCFLNNHFEILNIESHQPHVAKKMTIKFIFIHIDIWYTY